jgi:hypothetical protein
VVNHPAANAEAGRNGRLRESVIQEMSKKHEGIPSVHDGPPLSGKDVECGSTGPDARSAMRDQRTQVPPVCNSRR